MTKYSDIGGANLHTIFFNTQNHAKNCFIVFLDPQNMGVDTFIVPLYLILTGAITKYIFSVMAAQICMARGIFF